MVLGEHRDGKSLIYVARHRGEGDVEEDDFDPDWYGVLRCQIPAMDGVEPSGFYAYFAGFP